MDLLLGLDEPGGELLHTSHVLSPELHVIAVGVALLHGVLLQGCYKVCDSLELILVTLGIGRNLNIYKIILNVIVTCR